MTERVTCKIGRDLTALCTKDEFCAIWDRSSASQRLDMEFNVYSTFGTELESSLPELLPCPFCGARARCSDARPGWFVLCSSDDCRGENSGVMFESSREDAIAAWNRRAQPAGHDLLRDMWQGECGHSWPAHEGKLCVICGAITQRDAARAEVSRLEQELARMASERKLLIDQLKTLHEATLSRAVPNAQDLVSANLARLPPEISRNGR